MENIVIKEVPDSPYYPEVNFDAEKGICEISGESYMEETFKFYSPLLDWIVRYTKEVNKPLTFNFKLTYFNTNSSRLILDMLDILKKYQDNNGDVTVVWYYDPEDPDMIDEIEDFEMETGIKINLVELE
jgi:hypothetical protein